MLIRDRFSSARPADRRFVALSVIVVAIFLLYLGQLFSIQVINGYIYARQAERAQQRIEVIPPQRGEIYDRHYDVPLATNRPSYAVSVIPGEIESGDHSELFRRLARHLDVDADFIARKIPEESWGEYRSIEITSGVSLKKISYLAERISEFPGVIWRPKPIRTYTQGDALSHVLGYVGDITPQELKLRFNRGYTAGSIIGKSGIELQYDELLQGEEGRRIRRVDVRGRGVESDRVIAPVPGHNLILTIDRKIQNLVKEALGERIGSAVVLKPSTGEILAMISYPTFDPNRFYRAEAAQAFSEISLQPHSPFINRAIQASFEPASTFKILMTAAVVEEQSFGLSDTVNCRGYYRLGNRTFYEWNHNNFGHLNIFGALANSSNVFFWTMGVEHLGVERIVGYADTFGFGKMTGIDLPGETPGLVPNPEWKELRFKERWSDGDTANLSIGQGFLNVTPLQLANMVALIVNEGTVYRPFLLKEIREQTTGTLIERQRPQVLSRVNLNSVTYEVVKQAMHGVITEGTAHPVITTRNVSVAGKTGTSQVSSSEDNFHSWFVAYAPFDAAQSEEQVVLAIIVDAANEWEWWAPKAANIILHGIFSDRGTEGVTMGFAGDLQTL